MQFSAGDILWAQWPSPHKKDKKPMGAFYQVTRLMGRAIEMQKINMKLAPGEDSTDRVVPVRDEFMFSEYGEIELCELPFVTEVLADGSVRVRGENARARPWDGKPKRCTCPLLF